MLGVTESHFWDSTPKELEPYRIADEMRQERLDYNMWLMGHYVASSVQTAVSSVLAGKKSKAKYIDKPLMQLAKEERKVDPVADFEKFSTWAIVFNQSIESKGQGQ